MGLKRSYKSDEEATETELLRDTAYFKAASSRMKDAAGEAERLNREWQAWRDSPMRLFTSQAEIDRRYEEFSAKFDRVKAVSKNWDVD